MNDLAGTRCEQRATPWQHHRVSGHPVANHASTGCLSLQLYSFRGRFCEIQSDTQRTDPLCELAPLSCHPQRI